MSTSTAFIYGSITEEGDCPRAMPDPELFEDEGCEGDEAGHRCESAIDDGCDPCDECPERGRSGKSARKGSEARENGEVWWTRYEEPDKPIEDFTTRELGIHGEALAARYLSSRGLTVIEQNWRSRKGEIDIVAREPDGEVALVEVKTRLDLHGDPQCMPELAVDGQKQRRYRQIALIYLMCHPEVVRMRFDVIAINVLDSHNARLRHLVSAFTWDS